MTAAGGCGLEVCVCGERGRERGGERQREREREEGKKERERGEEGEPRACFLLSHFQLCQTAASAEPLHELNFNPASTFPHYALGMPAPRAVKGIALAARPSAAPAPRPSAPLRAPPLCAAHRPPRAPRRPPAGAGRGGEGAAAPPPPSAPPPRSAASRGAERRAGLGSKFSSFYEGGVVYFSIIIVIYLFFYFAVPGGCGSARPLTMEGWGGGGTGESGVAFHNFPHPLWHLSF